MHHKNSFQLGSFLQTNSSPKDIFSPIPDYNNHYKGEIDLEKEKAKDAD